MFVRAEIVMVQDGLPVLRRLTNLMACPERNGIIDVDGDGDYLTADRVIIGARQVTVQSTVTLSQAQVDAYIAKGWTRP